MLPCPISVKKVNLAPLSTGPGGRCGAHASLPISSFFSVHTAPQLAVMAYYPTFDVSRNGYKRPIPPLHSDVDFPPFVSLSSRPMNPLRTISHQDGRWQIRFSGYEDCGAQRVQCRPFSDCLIPDRMFDRRLPFSWFTRRFVEYTSAAYLLTQTARQGNARFSELSSPFTFHVAV